MRGQQTCYTGQLVGILGLVKQMVCRNHSSPLSCADSHRQPLGEPVRRVPETTHESRGQLDAAHGQECAEPGFRSRHPVSPKSLPGLLGYFSCFSRSPTSFCLPGAPVCRVQTALGEHHSLNKHRTVSAASFPVCVQVMIDFYSNLVDCFQEVHSSGSSVSLYQ